MGFLATAHFPLIFLAILLSAECFFQNQKFSRISENGFQVTLSKTHKLQSSTAGKIKIQSKCPLMLSGTTEDKEFEIKEKSGAFPKIPEMSDDNVCLVWFTGTDLRVHDNEALAAAANSKACVPVFVFDPEELSKLKKHTVASIHAAVTDLAESLEKIGVPLITRVGRTEEQLATLASQSDATHLLFHEDPVSTSFDLISRVQASVSGVELCPWRSHLLSDPWQGLDEVPTNFRDFKKSYNGIVPEELTETPLMLPLSPKFSDVQPIPSLETVFGTDVSYGGEWTWDGEVWEKESLYGVLDPLDVKETNALDLLQEYVARGDAAFGQSFLRDVSTAEQGLERASTKRIIDNRGAAGLAPGEAFSRMFALPLALGCVSPKRLARCRMPPFVTTFGVERPSICWAKEAAVQSEWHSLLARKDLMTSAMGAGVDIKYWRWNGWLTRYSVGGPEDAPVLVLVHGFGASVEQWKGLYDELKDSYKIYALDMLGFGHSQKPPLSYNQYSWANQVADFCNQVVKEPFAIAGNSIGGFIGASVAADMSDKCNGLILLNSAGRVLSKTQYQQELQNQGSVVEELTLSGALGPYRAPPNIVLGGFATALFYFLQGRIEKTCENLYPTNPGVVKEGLGQAIFRDSCDPGATGVIAAGGKLPTPRPMNELLAKYGGEVVVVQGVLDPLNDANSRADMFDQIGNQVSVVKLQAGHCPHDEQPGQVAAPIKEFLQRTKSTVQANVMQQ